MYMYVYVYVYVYMYVYVHVYVYMYIRIGLLILFVCFLFFCVSFVSFGSFPLYFCSRDIRPLEEMLASVGTGGPGPLWIEN